MKALAVRHWLNNNKGFILFILLMGVFRGAYADWYHIPSSSMEPTITIGDRILVDKTAYNINLPFSDISLIRTNEPERGDIVVFDSKAAKVRLIKRVIGLPGDSIAMNNEQVSINGKALDYLTTSKQQHQLVAQENLGNLSHAVQYLANGNQEHTAFTAITIPTDYYLVLGDNRRNSADSRYYGLVPRSELIGKANKVAFSLDYQNFYLPKTNRFWHDLYQN
ncbi:MAG: signal peptidase I [Thalassotalea sp.]